MNVIASSQPRALEIEARVTRCGCHPRQKLSPTWHGKRGEPCPCPRALEDLGRVAYWHRNPLRRLAWRLSQWVRGRRAGAVRFTS